MRVEKIYIAGPSVFAKNAIAIGRRYKGICEHYGFTGLYPLDNEVDDDCLGVELAERIFTANCDLIDQADCVVADLNPFRGQCMDDGTAFEIGYAFAKGKLIYGYIDDLGSLREKIGETDEDGYRVENFGLPINLMIASATVIVEGNFREAIYELRNNHR